MTAAAQGPALEGRDLCKRFGLPGQGELTVFEGLSLAVREGEVVAVMGPNGAGKSTLLHVLAGLHPPQAGAVHLALGPVALVFQDFAGSLLPWRTNLDNLALPLELAGLGRAERHARVQQALAAFGEQLGADLLAALGIPPFGYPYTLSQGQRQWLAILRAYLSSAKVVLLDEPFAALDLHGRLLAQERLAQLHHRRPRATVMVSHEVDEAVFLADRVVVLSRRPARVLAEVPVDLPRPRPRLEQAVQSARFEQLCHEVRRRFLEAIAA